MRCVLTIAMACLALVAVPASADDISRLNGGIEIDPGEQAGDLSTVNGGIVIGADGRVGGVDTVNGSIRLEDRAVVESAETVNGSITVGQQVEVQGAVSTVNGAVALSRGTRVAGRVGTVNGRISLTETTVGDGLETVNGDIDIGANSRVDGGILVEKNQGWSSGKQRNPKITIGAGAVVNGTLRFERPVDLYLSPTAKIGPLEGVAPVRHTLE